MSTSAVRQSGGNIKRLVDSYADSRAEPGHPIALMNILITVNSEHAHICF